MTDSDNGNLWNKYQKVKKLGEGGMGEVWLVRTARAEWRAAKLVNEERAQRYPQIKAQFAQEAELHPRLRHPHIVRCHEVRQHDIPQGIILSYVDGGSLRDRLKEKNALRTPEIMMLLQQISGALSYLHHQLGYCHCDVKPDNILCDTQGNYFLADFGISQRIGQPPETKRGAPKYMAPEQVQRSPVDMRTDVYSLALTVYEVLTAGFPPFSYKDDSDGTSPEKSLEYQHIYSKPPPPSSFRPSIRRSVDEIILKALQKEPDSRYQTVEEFYRAVERAVSNTGDDQRSATNGHASDIWLPSARLICTTGQAVPPLPLDSSVLIGRNQRECKLRLPDMQVSRRHALIEWQPEQNHFVVWDQGSKLGTTVNGKIVINEGFLLRNGDLISIGPFNFRFELLRS